MDEVDLIRVGYELGVYKVFGTDSYTIPLILLTRAWMKAIPREERDKVHLWGFIRGLKAEIPIPCDVVYRNRMKELWKVGVVEGIKFHDGSVPKFDYVLTDYGKAVCETHEDSVRAQIRLKKWRERAFRTKDVKGTQLPGIGI